MEKSEHLTEVVAAHHCRVVIYLLILEEEVEQIFKFLIGVTRDYPRLLVLLD